ncbi:MAG: phage portal protein [Planctomycetaceae bacterium]|nr:phage portal protein [Planctomycetaceae bacterium]
MKRKRVAVQAGMIDAVAHGEDDEYWKYANNAHADEIANAGEREKARARCRYQYLNDGYCRNIIRSFAITVVGQGARLQLYGDNKEINQIVENKFHQWIYETNIVEKLEMAVKAIMFDGETFLRFVYDEHIECGLNIAMIDAARVGSGWNGWNDPLSLDGIRFDQFGHPYEYCIFERVPNPNYNFKYLPEIVPAEEILHFFIPDFPEQHRGLPIILSVLKDFAALRRYRSAVVEAAEVAASTSIVIQTQKLPDTDEPDDLEEFDQVVIPRRGGLTLPRGWDGKQLRPEQPSANNSEFINTILTGIGAGVGQPRNVATNDSSNYNFSSAKLDHQTYYRYIKSIQLRVKHLCDKIFEKWVTCNVNDADVALLLFNATFNEQKIKRDWFFAEMEEIDPTSEANATSTLIKEGLMTHAEYHARKGKDPERQMEIWLAEQKRLRESQPIEPIKETLEKIETVKEPETENNPKPSEPPKEPEPLPKDKEPETENVQNTALNGAQVTSAVDIITKVSTGELPAETAVLMLIEFFNIKAEIATKMIEPAQKMYEAGQQQQTQQQTQQPTNAEVTDNQT